MYKSRKGFTLIELLIVTVVIVTLMGVVFRLAGVGSDSRRRAITIRRMQCLENALSGYYAAYGSYPPVPLQGRSRSIYTAVDTYSVQQSGNEPQTTLNPLRIHNACRAQPVAALFPSRTDGHWPESMEKLSEACTFYYGKTTKYKNKFSVIKNAGGINVGNTNWGDTRNGESVQLFQFGLMSFLLPRYFFMFSGNEGFYTSYNGKNQWGVNNQLPSRLDTGVPFSGWGEIRNIMGANNKDGRITDQEAGMISNLTSQSVCARWMPNLQGIVTGGGTFYGVNTHCSENDDGYFELPKGFTGDGIEYGELHIHARNGYAGENGSGGDLYILNCMTVRDGWHMDFYYYSEPPYQSYRLWSAGANRRTFPPWYDLEQFSSSDISTIRGYIHDDFVHLSN